MLFVAPMEMTESPRMEVILGLVAIILALAAALMALVWLSLRARSSNPTRTPPGPGGGTSRRSSFITPDQIDNLSARLDESTSDIVRLEDRIRRLESMLLEDDPRMRSSSDEVSVADASPPTAVAVSSHGVTGGADAAGSPDAVEPKTRDILRLAEAGYTPVEIAQRLDETTGTVQLVLSLHRSRASQDDHR